ncbi:MAG: rhodanese-related sulfurtransferase, partial [Gammaproteobacteria bacterium]
ATITDWMVRILQSDLFSLLPATNIQEVLAQMVLTPASANQAVVGEGAAGEHFYIVESGQYVVTKKAGATGREIKLATLGPGDSFGEAALITDTPRYATVTASKSGNLLKLDSGNFRRWVMDPAISRVSGDEAKSLSDNGDQWIDVREPAAYADGSIPSSLNIGINDVRLNVNRLATDRRYLVCHSDPKIAALGAFLLGERGFNVRCLDAPIKEYCEKFAVEAVISERENSSRTGRAATDDQEPMLLDGGGQQGQPPQTSVDKALPAGVDSDTTDPATMAQLALDVEHVQQLPDKNSIAKPDLNETVLGIGLTDLVGGLARTSAESSVNNSCDLAEAQTSDSLNSTNDGAPITRSAQPAGSDEQMTSLDCASETVALEERKEELPEHVPERSRDDVSTTNVVELHVTKDSGDATNKLKTGGSDQLGVFQQPSLADGPQRRSLIDLEASLSKDAEQVSGEMGAKVTEIVNRYLDIQRTDLEHEFENRITAVKQDAAKSMRAHELKVATGYKAKRQRIIDDGQKLVEFANKLKRFKDDLQRSQKQLEHQLAAKTD